MKNVFSYEIFEVTLVVMCNSISFILCIFEPVETRCGGRINVIYIVNALFIK